MCLKNKIFTILVASLLCACAGKDSLDKYEQLERPPEIAVTPSVEKINEINTDTNDAGNEKLTSNGLGSNIKLMGKKSAPLLKLNLDFDNTWLLLTKTLRHLKIKISDRDRDRGHYLLAYGIKQANAEEDEGLMSALTGMFGEKTELRKYQLSVMQTGAGTDVFAKDLGLVMKEADPEANAEEVINNKFKKPVDSEFRLMSVLYKTMQSGFGEEENERESGFLNDLLFK